MIIRKLFSFLNYSWYSNLLAWPKVKNTVMFGFKIYSGVTSQYLILAIQVILELEINVMLGFCLSFFFFLSLKSQLQKEVEGVL